MAAPTEEEKLLITQFRSRFSELQLDDDSDMYLLRWIRGRDHKLPQAEEMLRKHINWIAENDIGSILSWEAPEVLMKDYPVDIIGKDAENCPIGVLAFGKWDLKKCYDSGAKKDFIRYTDKLYVDMIHRMKGLRKPDGVPVTQFIAVYDMEGLSMKLLTSVGTMEMALETLRRYEANHPETLKKCYIVNASKIFSIIFSIVRPLLSQRTFSKVEVYDSDATKWKPVLQKAIPMELLPAKLGGNNLGSIINGCKSMLKDRDDLTSVTVLAGAKHTVQVDVRESNTVLSWSYLVPSHDIGFSLSSENEEIVKYERADGRKRPQEGSIICQRPGTYTLLFDNSYSRLRAKDIWYKVTLGNN